jgi:hypothetical protein
MVIHEQDEVVRQAIVRGLVRNRKDAHEAGCAALRRQLQELVEEESAKEKAAARAGAEAIERNPFGFLRESSPSHSPTE